MDLDLSGKKAVVTGAGSGIGLAVVQALVKEGATVLGGARTARQELLAATPHTLEVDLATESGPEQLVQRALTDFGGVDILVNNVGGGVKMARGFLDTDEQTWRRTFDLNFFSAVRATRAALPSLVERRGAIVNIGSVNSKLVEPGLVHYSAAKAALTVLGKALSKEFSPLGVRVNTISPGPVRTRIWSNPAWTEKTGMSPEEFVAKVPAMAGLTTGKMIEVDEIATLVLLLVSNKVPSIVGSDYIIDAGMLKNL